MYTATARQIEEEQNMKEISTILSKRKPYLLKQKILGTISIILSFVSLILVKADLLDGDAAIAFILLMLPIGLMLLFTREKVITF